MDTRILVIDDDQSMCELIRDHFQGQTGDARCEVEWRLSGDEGLDLVRDNDFDVVIADINLESMNGLDLCRKLRENRPDTPVIMITAFGSMANAVAAIRAGAFDFINKPIELPALAQAVERAARHRALVDKIRRLKRETAENAACKSSFIGESREMRRAYNLIRQVASTDTMVLLTGESGTGKELAARALHEQSCRAEMPFVAINCAAVPPQLLESELFGHAKGAFTDAKESRRGLFEQASGGTLLLDEIGEMPLDMQPKLLRVLQEKQLRAVGSNAVTPINARIVAATNRNLEEEVLRGRFREDLYYRLNVVQIQIPPLRARGKDVLLLARHFVLQFAERAQKSVTGLSDEAAQKLLHYDWPGNVRQLENSMERAVALTRSGQIEVEDLPERIRCFDGSRAALTEVDSELVLSLDEVEKRHIQRALQAAKGNKTQTAKALGVDRRTLYRKLERFEAERTALPRS
jgi:DNA-binding NtrC family response regulator